jgi:cold shock CspA family protein
MGIRIVFGKINYWNQPKGFGFLTVTTTENGAIIQQQYFFHHSNFTKQQVPVLGAFCVFELGAPFAVGRKVQAIGVRFATAEEIAKHTEITRGANALASKAGAE